MSPILIFMLGVAVGFVLCLGVGEKHKQQEREEELMAQVDKFIAASRAGREEDRLIAQCDKAVESFKKYGGKPQ